ncbi:MAG: hypothetical protein SF182_06550 [Deltaproteobacteria bacterium]|nr:hypothetical protein [Deltaproteobacteria bacterium]
MSATLRSRTIELANDPEALYALSLAEGWGDGAPLLPPTDARVQALLAATPHAADHAIGRLPPRHGVATVELAAINAAMAGCVPEAFPLVVAALEAIVQPEFNAVAITTTTSSVFPVVLVNGPRRDGLQIDYQAGCFGGAAGRGSMTVGRALSLCLRNIGGQRVGVTSRSVFGQAARFGQCLGEWEERSPWPSLAVRRGFAAGDEVVSVHASKGNFPVADTNNDDPRDLAYMLAKSIAYPMSNYYLEITGDCGQIVLAINPMWAERLASVFPRVEDFQQYLREHAWQPIDLWRPANQAVLEKKRRVDAQGRVLLVNRPEQLVPIVCGGLGGLHAMILPSWCQSEMQSVAVVRPAAAARAWSEQQVRRAVEAAAALVRSDGADLVLVASDAASGAIELRLEVGDPTCSTGTCVMPAEHLVPLLADVLRRHLPGPVELRLTDPRAT